MERKTGGTSLDTSNDRSNRGLRAATFFSIGAVILFSAGLYYFDKTKPQTERRITEDTENLVKINDHEIIQYHPGTVVFRKRAGAGALDLMTVGAKDALAKLDEICKRTSALPSMYHTEIFIDTNEKNCIEKIRIYQNS